MDGLTAGHLLAFNAALFLAVAAPGPAFLVCLQASLRGGPREGVLTGIGLAVMAGLWTFAALLGLEAVFEAYPVVYTMMKIGGGLLVIAFAVQTWLGAARPVADAPPASPRRAFLRGFLLNLGNPKSIIFSVGVLLVIFPPNLSGVTMLLVTLDHIALEIAVYSTLATLVSRDAIRDRYLAAKPLLMRAMGIVLGGLGLRLLVSP
ncbi:LysE family translocator [uncultured Jannaschia sp.]|uniref:LysE family translocator n=1 Tax=uncultured Jannaschia sp. TaxID=293347 RepID=UPI002628E9D4|nr:LysE family translocator [uncultured Jannaschia sp.]